jgi:epoxyqueuosine reductase
MEITSLLRDIIPDDGNWLYGFADLSGLIAEKYATYPNAVSIGRHLDDAVIDSLRDNGPTREYLDLYHRTNDELNALLLKISDSFSRYDILHMTIKATLSDNELSKYYENTLTVDFSHKMAATRAGLGWIGKTDLFVSKKFGPRVRLATLLADHVIPVSEHPVTESGCGSCTLCVEKCPAQAATGASWKAGMPREAIYNAHRCRDKCRELTLRNTGEHDSLCGICVSVCPIGRMMQTH